MDRKKKIPQVQPFGIINDTLPTQKIAQGGSCFNQVLLFCVKTNKGVENAL